MRHRYKKLKIKKGRDSNKSILMKLVRNFIREGKIITTVKKGKLLKSSLEILVNKAKKNTQADRNYLFKKIGHWPTIKNLITKIAPLVKDRVSGFINVAKIGYRKGDGAQLVKLSWTFPVVKEDKEEKNLKERSRKLKNNISRNK